ncbi:leucyl/phenylalanyl-tRNA--protein transferase [Aquirufa antheringensis]|jgi:leucyl/phenylalanyl-tRNA--protein transferase|uniref:Leucyl/phenylalanyl-tRNA--protein transferase n=1 Tax=Aquirufa antheringensis TaxID=2516559 RepID=A0A4Q9BEX0_9BACT|nr:leucyl/phenylalanyl-tRNA--protein transferase [Aquirufa antheringensis]MCL9968306.1 leucyl/phenylalanyl-tRNA--protein transferase [Aquirufa antheringensis]MCZ2484225.1 leucyl/phenylalanyl-tRNA--protein transferase [Aquirufa antheringensis]MCZ2489252.1 leucyl/phenylalanyl-tRNA--protein transferase [Aquirufa antheringensis]TBH72777.1 leucyl/phenylalanyl-tRNA--protein transferase [Aquirufa antheringensis]TBH74564.1 leucyl/phenylalanyl-tRNA--protein transferase [Aquirufa antheringensis]
MAASTPLTAETLVYAYASGVFPMAEETGEILWYSPDPRAIIPIQSYQPAKSLRPFINQKRFEIRIDTSFEQVMRNCALPRPTENETWISEEMIAAYTELHRMGLAHSVEAWQDGKLVGGLYGVALGAAFFGESMFSFVSNSSKIAFHYLVQILREQNYQLLDSQMMNDNVLRYGAVDIPRSAYLRRLAKALKSTCHFQKPTI